MVLADEVYGDWRMRDRLRRWQRSISTRRSSLLEPVESVSRARLACRMDGRGSTPRLDAALAAIKKLADGRLCSPGPMQHAVAPALTGDRSHQTAFRAALRERASLTSSRLNAIEGMSCVTPRGAFYAMPKVALPDGRTDADYVLALLCATGILCVHGSTARRLMIFRLVFLASPGELDRSRRYRRVHG